MDQLRQAIESTGAQILDSCTVAWGGLKMLHAHTVSFKGTRGVVLHYENPPVHQIDTHVLDAYASELKLIERRKRELSFLIFSFAPDPVHAGGDLKETLTSLRTKRGYRWADRRLLTAFALYKRVRALAKHLRIISVLPGGDYYGGSAEIALWADQMVGDPRTTICMSEATIGLIPGWGGLARLSTKAGHHNARCLVATARKTTARELKAIGVLDAVVGSCMLAALFQRAFKLALSKIKTRVPTILMSEDDMEAEVARRCDPHTYSHLWGKPLGDVRNEIAELKMPLAPQSIQALRTLFLAYGIPYEEEHFFRTEMKCDSMLYRHPLLAEGIRAVLEKRVPNFELKQMEEKS
ncbi:enoyl-CoA hydratase/isomerase family protein [Candidatus Kaiserbacteria bacterium]|nr:enoyl-CoA hydratase/isomerase family protein [Candidatus Kaiserbacteria bacterium]